MSVSSEQQQQHRPSDHTTTAINEKPPIALTLLDFALKPLIEDEKPPPPPNVTISQFPPDIQHKYELTFVKIVNSDHQFDPTLPHLYLDLLHYGAQLFYPNEFKTFEQCRTNYQHEQQKEIDMLRPKKTSDSTSLADSDDDYDIVPSDKIFELNQRVRKIEEDSTNTCLPLFEPVIEKLMPAITRQLQYRRQRYSPDPLEADYDAFQYADPIWFTGALNIWRRYAGGSKTVSIEQCGQFVTEYEQCLEQHNGQYSECFFEHFNSAICEPGFNCPSLQPYILQCAADNSNKSQLELENCFKKHPKFLPCGIGEHKETPNKDRPTIESAPI